LNAGKNLYFLINAATSTPGGRITASIAWMTPLDAATSATTTFAPQKKYVEIAKQLLNCTSVRKTYLEMRSQSGEMSIEQVMKNVRESGEAPRVGEESTLRRRSQTVLSWAKWLRNNFE
jgi:hypothetical protein